MKFSHKNPPSEALRLLQDPYLEYARAEASSLSLDYAVGGRVRRFAQSIARLPQASLPNETWVSPANGEQLKLEGVQENVKKPPYVPPSEGVVERFHNEEVPEYAIRRGFGGKTYRDWNLGNDRLNRRLVFPIRGFDKRIVGLTARLYWEEDYCFRCGSSLLANNGKMMKRCTICGQSYTKYDHTHGMPRSKIMFGAHLYVEGCPVVLVEGPTDAINLWNCGVRYPICLLGMPTKTQLRSIASMSKDVYVMGDGDKGGERFNTLCKEELDKLDCYCSVVEMPEGMDPGQLERSQVNVLLPKLLSA